jgi:hypothetical protein
MNSSESAEAVVRMTLQGSEVALKIAGSGTKELLIMLYTILNGQQKVKGRTTLTNMLKSGKELKVFSVKQEDLKKFTSEAKKYGVLFSVLMDKKNNNLDGVVDIMVKTEDAYKINRIVDRFNLASVNQAELKSEIEKEMIDKMMKEAKEKGVEVKTFDDEFLNNIMNFPSKEEINKILNPNLAKTEKSPLSEPTSTNKNNLEGTKSNIKPSVKKTLNDIKEEQKKKLDLGKEGIHNEKNKRTKTTKQKNTSIKKSQKKNKIR